MWNSQSQEQCWIPKMIYQNDPGALFTEAVIHWLLYLYLNTFFLFFFFNEGGYSYTLLRLEWVSRDQVSEPQ